MTWKPKRSQKVRLKWLDTYLTKDRRGNIVDREGCYFDCIDAEERVNAVMKLIHKLVMGSSRGVVWNCVLSRWVRAHPEVFPHPTYEAYTDEHYVYILARRQKYGHPKQRPLVVRYRHNFRRWADLFDRMPKTKFLRQHLDEEIKIAYMPPRRRKHKAGAGVHVVEHNRARPHQAEPQEAGEQHPSEAALAARQTYLDRITFPAGTPKPKHIRAAETRFRRAGGSVSNFASLD
jgi:hypothetical protein